MTRLSIALALLAACGDDDRPPLDPMCDMPGRDLDMPVIECPATVVVECVPPEGSPATFEARAAVCRGAPATVTCTPASGTVVMPGSSAGTCTAVGSTGLEASCNFQIEATPAGLPALICAPPITMACTSRLTEASIAEPTTSETCGMFVTGVTSDARPEGYPAGMTEVTYRATADTGIDVTCTVPVTVTDDMAPSVACDPTITIVRDSPDDPLELPEATVTDNCDDMTTVVVTPDALERGMNDVVFEATDHAGLVGTCTSLVTVTDLFTPSNFRIISAELATDGSTDVTLAWDGPLGGDATGVAIERATAMMGPWTRLMTVATAQRTFTDNSMTGDSAYYRLVTVADDVDGGTTNPLRAFSVTDTEYDFTGVTIPGIALSARVRGVVRHPQALGEGPFPLVLLLHGNHGVCRSSPTDTDDICPASPGTCTGGFVQTPNAEGYLYLLDTLAAQGYVAASLDGNQINCRNSPDPWIDERAQLILENIRRWVGWSTMSAPPFGTTFMGNVDMSNVHIWGHSRGGDAVALAAQYIAATPIPGANLTSVFSLAPTDYGNADVGPTNYAVLLPGCDGDVSSLEGANIYDRSAASNAADVRAQVLYVGANHNFFNTSWAYDDGQAVCAAASRIGAPAQRGMMEAVISAWVNGTNSGSLEPMIRAESGVPEGIDAWAGRALDLRWSYVARRQRIDEFSGTGTPMRNLLGEMNTFTGFTRAERCTDAICNTAYLHQGTGALILTWEGAPGTASIGLGGLDLSAQDYVMFRVASRNSTINRDAGVTEQDFLVRLRDGGGMVAELPVSNLMRIPHLYSAGRPYTVLQSIRIPVARLAASTPGFDRASVEAVELETSVPGHATGSIAISDFAAGD